MGAGLRKFYHTVNVDADEGDYIVTLDGRPIKTPGKAPLRMPTEKLAQAVASEWAAQEEDIDPATMPFTQLVNTALDRVAKHRETVVAEIVAFGDTDLLCYRDGSDNSVLARQQHAWDPILQAFSARHGVMLNTTDGVMPIKQPPELKPILIDIVEKFDSFSLTAFHTCVSVYGSILLALAVFEEELDAESAWSLSILEQTVQEERWGTDSEVEEKRDKLLSEIRTSLDLKHLLTA